MDPEHGLSDTQVVLTRLAFVVDVGARNVYESQTDHIAAHPCPLTRSWFAGVEAKICAVAGEETACRVALERSRQAFEKASPKAPAGLYFFDEAELRAYEGACYERIGKLELARDTWELALSALGCDRVRDRADYLVHLAGIQARQGEIEDACRLASDALAVAVETSSVRTTDQIHKLRTQLDPWKETRVVRDFEDRLGLVR